MLSVVKKVRPIKRGDLQSPYPNDMMAITWVLGITYPQSIKRLGHFLTADNISGATEDNISAGTPNGGRAYPALRNFIYIDTTARRAILLGTPPGRLTEDGHIRRSGISGATEMAKKRGTAGPASWSTCCCCCSRNGQTLGPYSRRRPNRWTRRQW